MSRELSERLQWFLGDGAVTRNTQTAPGIAVGSLRGPVREENQDRAAVAYVVSDRGLGALIGIVCDGLGGMKDGGVAANLCLSEFLAYVVETLDGLDSHLLEHAILRANQAVHTRFHGNGGTTLTAVIALGTGDGWAVHAGDSRLYSIDDGVLSLLTRDDTLEGVAKGLNADEDVLDNRLLQFVGIGDSLDPQVFPLPHIRERSFLLTSDGAHSAGRRILEGVVKNSRTPADWVRRITYIADATSVADNATAVALSVGEFQPSPRFRSGSTIVIWSPTSVLELWLQEKQGDHPQEPRQFEEHVSRELASDDVRQPKPKPRRGGKKKVPNRTGQDLQPERPQLQIRFGDRGGSSD